MIGARIDAAGEPAAPHGGQRPGPRPLRARHHVEHTVYRLVDRAIRTLPHGAARPIGFAVGDLWYVLAGERRRLAHGNLLSALPELTAERRHSIARACFRQLAAAVCEALSAARLDLVALCSRLTLEGWENLDQAEADGRGLLVLSAHLGNWEVAAHPIGIYRGPLHVVARPIDNPLLDLETRRLRAVFGNVTIDKEGAVRRMLKVLGDGGRVGMLIDQMARYSGRLRLPFFGRPAWTTTTLAALSLRTGAPVVPYFGLPAPGGRYRIVARPPIRPEGNGPAAVGELTRRYLAAVEEEIRRFPQGWTWMHDRWKA